jgi:hypothetical protein
MDVAHASKFEEITVIPPKFVRKLVALYYAFT